MSSPLFPQIEHGSFAGHETFPFRYTWLRKAIDLVTADPEAFGREDAMVHLGVGKNMVRSMRHWAMAAGVIEEDSDSGQQPRAQPSCDRLREAAARR